MNTAGLPSFLCSPCLPLFHWNTGFEKPLCLLSELLFRAALRSKQRSHGHQLGQKLSQKLSQKSGQVVKCSTNYAPPAGYLPASKYARKPCGDKGKKGAK